jgi:hypothetical protein
LVKGSVSRQNDDFSLIHFQHKINYSDTALNDDVDQEELMLKRESQEEEEKKRLPT